MKNKDPWDYDKFLSSIIALIAIIFILTIGSCCIHTDYRISQAIEAGIDPILARAAFTNTDEGYARLIYIAKKER